jgi:sugar phosphate isomerase/epimerase
MISRRKFFQNGLMAGLGLAFVPKLSYSDTKESSTAKSKTSGLKISLAEWSLREWIRSGKISNLEFPETAKKVFGIDAVEYVSGFFDDKVTDQNYLKELKQRTDDQNIRNVLIMVDMWGPEGTLASPDSQKRKRAAQNHHKWVDAAKFLGCHAIRVNASGYGDAGYEDAKKYFADGLAQLVEYGKSNGVSILVENHGGHSSNASWLAAVMQEVNDDYCGTLPDFGNFRISREQGIFYDPLVGLSELMPYAKGVSAKANQFDSRGNETTIDYPKMMEIVKTAGFNGYIGIEWGGGGYSTMKPEDGIRTTKAFLVKNI